MKSPGQRAAAVPVVALCLGLALLAVLEIRWAGEIERGERGRLHGAIDAAAGRFSDDLARELGDLLAAFRPTGGRFVDARALGEQRVDWHMRATDPDLLRDVLVATRLPPEPSWRLQRLQGDQLIDVQWDPSLEPVRRRLEGGGGDPRGPLVAEVPALLVGGGRPPLAPEGPPGAFPPGPLPSIVILVLDGDVLRSRVLPALASRHFAGLDCDVAVVAPGGRGDVLFATSADVVKEGRRADLVRPLSLAPAGEGFRPRLPPRAPEGMLPPDPPPVPRDADARAPWHLVVVHRAGSVEAAAAHIRQQVLLLGTGVLVLLGGSATLVLLSARRAQDLARRQIEFVASVSHELRTPVAALRSAGQNLADGVVEEPAQVRRYGVLVRDEAQRLQQLVEHTLEMSGMMARGGSLRLAEVQLLPLVREAVAEAVPAGGPATVEVDVAADLPTLAADPLALRNAVRNLVDNALKHGDGAWAAVRARMGAGGNGRELSIAVEDRGPGLAGEDPQRLFEPFQRGASAQRRRVPGSGLGLAVVRQVAEAHGGRLTVDVAPGGRGARFTLHLPIAEPRA